MNHEQPDEFDPYQDMSTAIEEWAHRGLSYTACNVSNPLRSTQKHYQLTHRQQVRDAKFIRHSKYVEVLSELAHCVQTDYAVQEVGNTLQHSFDADDSEVIAPRPNRLDQNDTMAIHSVRADADALLDVRYNIALNVSFPNADQLINGAPHILFPERSQSETIHFVRLEAVIPIRLICARLEKLRQTYIRVPGTPLARKLVPAAAVNVQRIQNRYIYNDVAKADYINHFSALQLLEVYDAVARERPELPSQKAAEFLRSFAARKVAGITRSIY